MAHGVSDRLRPQPEAELTSDDAVQALLQKFFPAPQPYEVVHRNLYVTHQRVAATFRKGRVLLAGDAAHVNNPIGGMGLNGGIQDGVNLADKLARIMLDGAPDRLLDLYDLQRRTVAVEFVQEQSIANKKRLEARDPEVRKRNLDELRAIAADPARARQFLLRTSMIASQRRAAALELGGGMTDARARSRRRRPTMRPFLSRHRGDFADGRRYAARLSSNAASPSSRRASRRSAPSSTSTSPARAPPPIASTARWRDGKPLSPIDGMPVGIKDIIDTADMPTEMGSPLFAGWRSEKDAACVSALRQAGAVIVGKTVTTEFAASEPRGTRNPVESRPHARRLVAAARPRRSAAA